jgi:hypothetical protein
MGVSKRDLDVDYLNRFLRQAWPGVAEILEADITHRAFVEVERQPVRMSRRRTRLDLSSFPAFASEPSGELRLRIPEQEAIRFISRMFLLPRLPWPRIEVDVGISIDVRIGADTAPETNIDAKVSTNLLGDLIGRRVDWREGIEKQFTGEDFASELGYFSLARYAPDAVPEIPEPERVYPEKPTLDGAINIVLVPENFEAGDFARFDEMVGAVVATLSQYDDSHANEPFFSFRSAISIWTIKPDQTPDGDHVLGAFRDPRGHRRVALANLARLAAIGRAAEGVGSGPTFLAIVVNPEAPRFEQERPPAMALGNLVLQPVQDSPQEDAWLLLHELGHTSLARLGDEYVLSSRSSHRYVGTPLRQPNLTSDPQFKKWRNWIDAPSQLPEWDRQRVTGAEGAGYFGSGIWRPAETCAMRRSKDGVPFCAVCREALTNGIRRLLGDDRMILRVTQPSGEEIDLKASSTAKSDSPARISVPLAGRVTIAPVAGTLPEPWSITARIAGQGSVEVAQGESGAQPALSVSAFPGDRLDVTVASRCQFAPWNPIPPMEIEFKFVAQSPDD